MIKHNFVPEHLGRQFLKVYEQIYHDRLKAKEEGDKVTAETLKLSLNGTYGNLINEHSWLYDPKAAMSITVNGQLMLLMLIEMLTQVGCKIVSANTDGITAIVPNSKKNEYYMICKKWESLTKMNLEYVSYEKLIFYAVNDYIAVKNGFTDKLQTTPIDEIESLEKNYIKEKGLFITKPRLGKGLKPLCISHCLLKHFVYGKSIYENIKEISDIRMFLMAEKTGKQWTVEYNNEKQQRVNRFYATKKGLNLYKWKYEDDGTKQYQNMLSASPVKILNTIDHIDNIDTYDVNYGYYTKECSKLIEEIEPKQLTLF